MSPADDEKDEALRLLCTLGKEIGWSRRAPLPLRAGSSDGVRRLALVEWLIREAYVKREARDGDLVLTLTGAEEAFRLHILGGKV